MKRFLSGLLLSVLMVGGALADEGKRYAVSQVTDSGADMRARIAGA